MKRKLLLLLTGFVSFSLLGCNDNSSSSQESVSSTPEESESSSTEEVKVNYYEYEAYQTDEDFGLNEFGLAKDIQDGSILHAWNWSYKTIKDNLASIASSGFSAVQTSPVQQSKSSSTTGGWEANWSMLYQPVSFSIAETSWLGCKQDLIDLCNEANKYGVKIICDIVVNHMGNDNTGQGYSERIAEFEPEIYSNLEKYFHQYNLNAHDSDVKGVTQYKLSGLPDLNTSDDYVQQRVISLLKECIDCGVSGFRFDAAKHIETPDDGAFASMFWPNILNASTEYAKNQYSKDMFYYGEILNSCGHNRSFDSYTKYMSVTDNVLSNGIATAVNNNRAKNLTSYLKSKVGGIEKSVLWNESHDTYADKSTSSMTNKVMNKSFAIASLRNKAAGLYFARPNATTAMGDKGSSSYKEVKQVNKFKNEFIGSKEVISVQDSFFINEKYRELDDKHGALIVGLYTKNPGETTIYFKNLKDGDYYDQISGEKYTCKDGKITANFKYNDITVLTSNEPVVEPSISISEEKGYFYDSFEVKLSATNADKLSYTVNDNESIEAVSGEYITINSDKDVTLKVFASKGDVTVSETYYFYQVEKKEGYAACAGLMDPSNCEVYAWTWASGGQGKWTEVEVVGNVVYLKVDETMDYYLLATFPKGTTFESLDPTTSWSYKIGQTSDIYIDLDKVEISTI